MKILKKENILPAFFVVLLILVSIPAFGYITRRDTMTKNGISLKNAVTAAPAGEVSARELIPFAWDQMYVFFAPASKEEIEAAMGLESGDILPLEREGETALYLVEDNRLICRTGGLPEAEGFAFTPPESAGFLTVSFSDQAVFSVAEEEGIKVFTLKGQGDSDA